MKRLDRALRTRLFPSIVQCSPVRTGSTLVWNALRALFPGMEIPKRHDLNPLLRSSMHPCRIVATVRDPRDVIVSMLAASNEEVTEEAIQRKLVELDRHGLSEMMLIQNRPRTLILRYEEIHADHEVLFSLLGEFFKVRVDDKVVVAFHSRFHIDHIIRKSKNLAVFEQFDPIDQIHGRHISESKGVPGAHHLVLNNVLRTQVEKHCSVFMESFGYSPDNQMRQECGGV